MKFGFLLAAMIATVGSASLAVSGTADALTMASLHCPASVKVTLQIVHEGSRLEIRGTTLAAGAWAGGAVGARVIDRRELAPGSYEAEVELPPLVAWVRGSQVVCGYRLTTAAYRVDAQLSAECPAGSGACTVPGDGRAPENFRFDHAR